MPKYFTMTRSGPQFMLRIPAKLSKRLPFSTISFPMLPAPRLKLRFQAQEIALRARSEFAVLEKLDDETLANMSSNELQSRLNVLMPNSSSVASLIEHPDPAVQKIAWQNTTEFLQLALEKIKRGAPEPTPEFISRRQCYFLDGFMRLAMDNRKGCVFAKDIDQLLLKALFVANGCDKLRMTKDDSALRYETEADRLVTLPLQINPY